ncbi:hypothetical protein D187_003627 [Cystobacter fuscus DSM 2262]|uniref:Uncharacterized protein n=1 Tax=Cystobacter fuscus (strain ATCC 25194 / DSM 2262 / NBRC 100088 / M29) TaxID=1242864 RepID=S9P9F8_CYSF2|nr:hypothetical protein D187_003627 [Cystobacter fuscus DSM 2262]
MPGRRADKARGAGRGAYREGGTRTWSPGRTAWLEEPTDTCTGVS